MIDTSLFVASGRDVRRFAKEVVVPARRPRVFDLLTTAEGWSGVLGARTRVELRVGGPLEIFFLEDAPEGSRGSEGCQFLCWVPDELVAFSWNAPPHLPGPRSQRAWVVVTLADDDAGTRLRLVHAGFGEGPAWDETYAYFDRAWGRVLDQLAAYAATHP